MLHKNSELLVHNMRSSYIQWKSQETQDVNLAVVETSVKCLLFLLMKLIIRTLSINTFKHVQKLVELYNLMNTDNSILCIVAGINF